MNKRVGIIGFGNMGSAIAERIKSRYEAVVFDKDTNKTKDLQGVDLARDSVDLVKKVDTLILAVKPQEFEVLLKEIGDYAKDKLVISIAAGITAAYIERLLIRAHVVRAMPNLPAKVGEGMIVLSKGRNAKDSDLSFTQELFSSLGKTLIVDEAKMDAVTAVSGSGPGFLFSFLQTLPREEWLEFTNNTFAPALIQAAERLGFSAQEAKVLASTTANGSIALLAATGSDPESLCTQVTSKGGTTEAGLKVLRGDIQRLPEAIEAAKKRSEELSKG